MLFVQFFVKKNNAQRQQINGDACVGMILYLFPDLFHCFVAGDSVDNQNGFFSNKVFGKFNGFKCFSRIFRLIDENQVKRGNKKFQLFQIFGIIAFHKMKILQALLSGKNFYRFQ